MLTPEEHKRARFQGHAAMSQWLAGMVRGGMTPEIAESVVAGAVDCAREFLLAYVSERAAYELLQRAADRVPVDKAGSIRETQP